MQHLVRYLLASLILSFPAKAAEIISTNLKVSGGISTVLISDRVNVPELLDLTKAILSAQNSQNIKTICFYLKDQASPAWSCLGRDDKASGEFKVLTMHFSKDEWNSFGIDGGLYPPDSQVIGVWNMKNVETPLGDHIISIYKWRGETYYYRKFEHDGSGDPRRVTSEHLPIGEAFTDYDSENDYIVLTKSGTLVYWDNQGPIETYKSRKMEVPAH
ncbi:hypothetical protein [Pleomorphomonas carboxyditropha]|uniref:hypothetical protein n=1 Tax=Pleomorphomonas carboxyditropha TaxID=2023338 RepID=UPI001055BD91|nr:hypothetical protein [Pleomorphomonas carboxyditropha]